MAADVDLEIIFLLLKCSIVVFLSVLQIKIHSIKQNNIETFFFSLNGI